MRGYCSARPEATVFKIKSSGRERRITPLLCDWQVNTIFEELKTHILAGEKFLALEKFQNLILMGLSLRTDFFRYAAMFGGTSLRIFHGLPRFSEDLDFTVDWAASDFTLLPYRESLCSFFEELGIGQLKFNVKGRAGDVAAGSIVLPISRSESLRVKIDAEKTQFVLAPETETLYGSFPFQYPARICRLSSGFAGKMDAIINRQWGAKRVKGGDWYDLLWYLRKGTELNLLWLEERLKAKGTLASDEQLSPELLGELYEKRAATVDVKEVLRDVAVFMTDSLEKSASTAWSSEMFLLQKEKVVDAARRFILSKNMVGKQRS